MWQHLRPAIRVCVLGAVVAGVAAAGATAAAPIKVPVTQADFTLPASVCGFPVAVHFDAQNQHARVFSNGAFAAEGMLFVTLSANGKSVSLNVSGPGRVTPNADGTASVRVEGLTLIFFNAGDLGPGQPGAAYFTTGLTTETIDAHGAPIPGSFHTTGTVTDVCPLLA